MSAKPWMDNQQAAGNPVEIREWRQENNSMSSGATQGTMGSFSQAPYGFNGGMSPMGFYGGGMGYGMYGGFNGLENGFIR